MRKKPPSALPEPVCRKCRKIPDIEFPVIHKKNKVCAYQRNYRQRRENAFYLFGKSRLYDCHEDPCAHHDRNKEHSLKRCQEMIYVIKQLILCIDLNAISREQNRQRKRSIYCQLLSDIGKDRNAHHQPHNKHRSFYPEDPKPDQHQHFGAVLFRIRIDESVGNDKEQLHEIHIGKCPVPQYHKRCGYGQNRRNDR